MDLNENNKIKKVISENLVKKYKGKSNYQVTIPSTDYDWICYNSGLPWLELDIKIPVNIILKEIYNIQHLLVSHRDEYNEHKGWKSFCIHGKSFDSTREDEHYNNSISHHFTKQAKELMPQTVDYFKNQFPAESFKRVRVMLLEPGGYITLHKDDEYNNLSAVNIAITQPDNCHFIMDRYGEIPFTAGKSFLLDIGNMHTVFNLSDQPRYHIIAHAKKNNKFKEIVVNSYNQLYNQCV